MLMKIQVLKTELEIYFSLMQPLSDLKPQRLPAETASEQQKTQSDHRCLCGYAHVPLTTLCQEETAEGREPDCGNTTSTHINYQLMDNRHILTDNIYDKASRCHSILSHLFPILMTKFHPHRDCCQIKLYLS
jgi:hypothetical protein